MFCIHELNASIPVFSGSLEVEQRLHAPVLQAHPDLQEQLARSQVTFTYAIHFMVDKAERCQSKLKYNKPQGQVGWVCSAARSSK